MPQFAVTVKFLQYYRGMASVARVWRYKNLIITIIIKNDDNTMGMGKIHGNYHCSTNTVVNVMLPLLYTPSTERL